MESQQSYKSRKTTNNALLRMLAMTHHYHAVKNEHGDLIKVLMTLDGQAPVPEYPSDEMQESLRVETVAPDHLLRTIELIDLRHYMSDMVLECFIEDAQIGRTLNVQSDIGLAIRTDQPILLKALLDQLNPEDCPPTFDHYGYRTMRDHHLGQSVARAMDRCFECGDTETLKILLGHDTVMRTILDNANGYRSIADSYPEMARLLDQGLSFKPADPLVQEYRLQSLNHRINTRPYSDDRGLVAQVQELKAITRSITLGDDWLFTQPLSRQIARSALALGFGGINGEPLPFASGFISLGDLIARYCDWNDQKRSSARIADLAETVASLGVKEDQKHYLTPNLLARCRQQACDSLRFPVPGLGHDLNDINNAPHLTLGTVEAYYADDKILLERLAHQLASLDRPNAKAQAKNLATLDPDDAKPIAGLGVAKSHDQNPLPSSKLLNLTNPLDHKDYPEPSGPGV